MNDFSISNAMKYTVIWNWVGYYIIINSVENSIIDTVKTLASPVWRVAVNSVRYPIVNSIQDYFKQNE